MSGRINRRDGLSAADQGVDLMPRTLIRQPAERANNWDSFMGSYFFAAARADSAHPVSDADCVCDHEACSGGAA